MGGFGVMGFGLLVVFGVVVIYFDIFVIDIDGDGSFIMNI